MNSKIPRIPTRIVGLDRLLNGGLNIIRCPFTIVIRGGMGTESTHFCLQLLYGIALSLNETERELPPEFLSTPIYVSSCHNEKDVENILTNSFISSCLYSMTGKIIENAYDEPDKSIITNILFDTSKILCVSDTRYNNVNLPINEIENIPDTLKIVGDGSE